PQLRHVPPAFPAHAPDHGEVAGPADQRGRWRGQSEGARLLPPRGPGLHASVLIGGDLRRPARALDGGAGLFARGQRGVAQASRVDSRLVPVREGASLGARDRALTTAASVSAWAEERSG